MSASYLSTADSPHVDVICPSPNVNERADGCRPRYLIMHYTGLESVERSIDVLSRLDCEVSCHYVIDVDGTITQMVPEALRAWHAGQSSWLSETDLNSLSIGIEIQNPGHANGYPDFPTTQMRAVLKLSQDITARNAILPSAVLGHSDIAPGRKIDPGEKFRWDWLCRNGVGHWVEPVPASSDDPGLAPGSTSKAVRKLQTDLKDYGYGIEVTGTHDDRSVIVVTAFQRHFRPSRIDGWIDQSTCRTLSKLLEAREDIKTV
jgi:N-acetylmuramoyl-L-alanine amidase